jgi:cation transporter-like permease
MALCLQQVGEYLQVAGEFSDQCTGYALMTANEYATTPTFAALFAQPEPEVIAAAFMAAMVLPLSLWLVAWGFGSVVHFIDRRSDPDAVHIND